jgi:hypothetical protein
VGTSRWTRSQSTEQYGVLESRLSLMVRLYLGTDRWRYDGATLLGVGARLIGGTATNTGCSLLWILP